MPPLKTLKSSRFIKVYHKIRQDFDTLIVGLRQVFDIIQKSKRAYHYDRLNLRGQILCYAINPIIRYPIVAIAAHDNA